MATNSSTADDDGDDALWPPPSAAVLTSRETGSVSSSQTGSVGGKLEEQTTKPKTNDDMLSEIERKMSFSDDDDDDDDCEDDKEEEKMELCVGDNSPGKSQGYPMERLTRINEGCMPDVGRIIASRLRNSRPAWDHKHVRMPYADLSEHGVRRWSKITDLLNNIRREIPGITEFQNLKNIILEYNPTYRYRWEFGSLEYFIQMLSDEERSKFLLTLDRMGKLAAGVQDICPEAIPLLRKIGRTDRDACVSLTLSRQQIACLLANAFFCTFPMRNQKPSRFQHSKSDTAPLPSINFSSLFKHVKNIEAQINKLRCIVNYFQRVTTEKKLWESRVTFERRALVKDRDVDWDNSETFFSNLHATSMGKIETEGAGMLQVDFANKLVGGGVLGRGCVQEEIRFLGFTEMIVSRLFTEELSDHECLIITGCQQYNDYYGYSYRFRWNGDYDDRTPSDHHGRRLAQVVVMDAKKYFDPLSQFNNDDVRRELNKAYCGFYRESTPAAGPLPAVATGNWGCGDFAGDRQLKSLIQLMAAAEAKRDVCYFTFKDPRFVDDLCEIHDFIRDVQLTVGDVWKIIEQYSRKVARTTPRELPDGGLFGYIRCTYSRMPAQS